MPRKSVRLGDMSDSVINHVIIIFIIIITVPISISRIPVGSLLVTKLRKWWVQAELERLPFHRHERWDVLFSVLGVTPYRKETLYSTLLHGRGLKSTWCSSQKAPSEEIRRGRTGISLVTWISTRDSARSWSWGAFLNILRLGGCPIFMKPFLSWYAGLLHILRNAITASAQFE